MDSPPAAELVWRLSCSRSELKLWVCLLRPRGFGVSRKVDERGDIAREAVETGDSGGEPSQCWLSFRCMVKCLRGIGEIMSERSVSDLSRHVQLT